MPAVPMFDETEDLAGRVVKNPKKYLTQLLRGMARGTAALPGDVADMAGMALGQRPGAGAAIRQALDEYVPSLKGEGTTTETVGEVFSPSPPFVKGVAAGGILVDAARAAKGGHLHPQALADALKWFKQGVSPKEIYAKTRVDVSQPSVLNPQPHALFPLETPGYSQGPGPVGGVNTATLESRVNSGDMKGLDDYLSLYPEAKSMRVIKTDQGPLGNFGWFSPATNELGINYAMANKAPKSALAAGADKTAGHELAHFAQDLGGMAPGASSQAGAAVSGLAPKLMQRGQDIENASLIRFLMENGSSNPPVHGGFSMTDVMEVLKGNRSMFRNSPKVTKEAANAAQHTPYAELEKMARMNLELQQKVPQNPFDAYLKAWGEQKARQSEEMLGKHRTYLDLYHPDDLPYKHPVPAGNAFDLRDFDPMLLAKLGLI